MKVGDTVREKFTTNRVGIVVDANHLPNGQFLKVVFTTGQTDKNYAYHFWEVNDESR